MHWCFGSEIHLVLHLIPNAFTCEVGSSRRPIVVVQGIKDTKLKVKPGTNCAFFYTVGAPRGTI
jgi:hypothetical protein